MKTQFFEKKKANFPVKKSFWPFFSRFLECDRPQGPIYEYPQSISTNFFEVKGLILLHLRGCWKHKYLKKKGKLSSEKKVLANFFSLYQVWWNSRDYLKGSTSFYDKYCGSYRVNSVTPKKFLKTQNFEEKKGKLSCEKKFLAYFFSHYRVW